jgi:DNA polymerase III subunit alpha
VPQNPANPVTLAQGDRRGAALQEAREDEPRSARLLDIAQKLEGLYRHASTHAAGIVIGDRPLDRNWCRSIAIRAPTCRSPSST